MLPLKTRLLGAEDDFLQALGQGGDTICLFERRWESLVEDIDALAEADGLDDEMAMLAHVVSSRLATLLEASVDLSASIDTLTGRLVNQLDILMSEISLDDASPPKFLFDASSSSKPPPHPSLPSTPSRKRRRSNSRVSSDAEAKRQRTTTSSPMGSDRTVISMLQDAREQSLPIPSSPRLRRKRRLSEADGHPCPHRSKPLHVGPRLHAVSDSFPLICPSSSKSAGSGNVEYPINPTPKLDLSLPLDILLSEELSDSTLSRVSEPLLTDTSFLGDGHFGADMQSTPTEDLSLFLDTLVQPSYPDLTPPFIPSFDANARPEVYAAWTLSPASRCASPSSVNSPSSTASSPPPSTPPLDGLDLAPPLYQAGSNEHSAAGAREMSKSSTGTDSDLLPYRSSCQTLPPLFTIEAPSLHLANDWTVFDTVDPLSWLSIPSPPYQFSPCFDSPSENAPVPLETTVIPGY